MTQLATIPKILVQYLFYRILYIHHDWKNPERTVQHMLRNVRYSGSTSPKIVLKITHNPQKKEGITYTNGCIVINDLLIALVLNEFLDPEDISFGWPIDKDMFVSWCNRTVRYAVQSGLCVRDDGVLGPHPHWHCITTKYLIRAVRELYYQEFVAEETGQTFDIQFRFTYDRGTKFSASRVDENYLTRTLVIEITTNYLPFAGYTVNLTMNQIKHLANQGKYLKEVA